MLVPVENTRGCGTVLVVLASTDSAQLAVLAVLAEVSNTPANTSTSAEILECRRAGGTGGMIR
eukprot:5672676-Prymnesium_polylepis.1